MFGVKFSGDGSFHSDFSSDSSSSKTDFDGYEVLKGEDGYTPQKGVDYFTEEDKNEIVQQVIDELPKYDGGYREI